METEIDKIIEPNAVYKSLQGDWQYYLNSYLGGSAYRNAGYLTKYTDEKDTDYSIRVSGTYLDNHCNSVVSVYNSFLFRQPPIRELGQLKDLEETEAFLADADLDGRSLNSFMKDVTTWSSVFGHCWMIVAKPNINAGTRADELNQGVRPYVSLLTPLAVLDWHYIREPNGLYVLDYLKYIEETTGDIQYIKEWTPEAIKTFKINTADEELISEMIEDNQLNEIPAVIAYADRSIHKGVGVSDINDIADAQRYIYNNNSEIDQSIRIDTHPVLVKTKDTKVNAGAGAIANMPVDLDAGLKPYMLQTNGADINAVLDVTNAVIASIDKMANTGAVRTNESVKLSGIAMQTEFQLLNARLSEKADNLELAEEQMWRIFATYQDKAWDGEIVYPDSFNISDTQNEIIQLKEVKATTQNSDVADLVDKQIVELLGEDPDEILISTETTELESSV